MSTPRVVISGYYGFGNFGDEAALAILANALHDHGLDVTALTFNGAASKQAPQLEIANKRKFQDRWSAIKNADCVVIGPGGVLKRPAGSSFFAIGAVALRDALVAQALGVPFLLYSVSASKTFARPDWRIMRSILRNATWIGARDQHTVSTLSTMGLSQVDLVQDSIEAFSSTSHAAPHAATNGERRFVAVAPSASDQAFWESDAAYREALVDQLRECDLPMVGVVCQSGPNGDRPILEALVASGLTFTEIYDWSTLSTEEAAATLSDVATLVASRFHAGILGRALGIHVIPFGRDGKLDRFATPDAAVPTDRGIAGFVAKVDEAIAAPVNGSAASALVARAAFFLCQTGHYSFVAYTRARRRLGGAR